MEKLVFILTGNDKQGFKIATLGESILKVEQAAVVCVGVGLDHFNGGK